VLKLTADGVTHTEQVKGGMGYMSANDPRVAFGLGKRAKIESLEITWPSGQVDKLTNVPVDSIIAAKEGAGIVPHPFPKFARASATATAPASATAATSVVAPKAAAQR
jgi:hypothetical protein